MRRDHALPGSLHRSACDLHFAYAARKPPDQVPPLHSLSLITYTENGFETEYLTYNVLLFYQYLGRTLCKMNDEPSKSLCKVLLFYHDLEDTLCKTNAEPSKLPT